MTDCHLYVDVSALYVGGVFLCANLCNLSLCGYLQRRKKPLEIFQLILLLKEEVDIKLIIFIH